jgi:fibronectin-binding autotransporter adhesin
MARNSHGMMAAASRATPGNVTDNWVGGAGGNGDWNTAADWSGGVPADAATAVFATGDFGYTVTGDATIGAIMVNGDGVTFDGTLTQDSSGPATFLTGINGADVTLDANSFVTGGAINFQDGSLLEVQGTLITTGGTADVVLVDGLNADAIASSAITLNQLYVQNGASFTGDVMLNDGGNITLDASSSFGGDTVTLLGSGTIYDAAAPGGAGGGGSVADNIVFATAGGTLNLAADPGVTLLVTGDISGAGSLVVSGGTVELAGDNTFTGGIDVQYGTLQLDTSTALPSNLVILSGGALVTEVLASGMLTDSVVAATGTADTVTATGGALLVFGAAAASLTFTGGADHSTVVGGLAALTVQGGSAGDAIFGGSATLNFTGGAGFSTVIGGAGQVIANGGATGSVIFGGTSGLDQLSTGTGNSTLVGGAASTTFFGSGAGSSLIVVTGGGLVNLGAATGNDTVFGGNFANTIEGGIGGTETDVLQAGNTTLYGNTGISEVFGGSGSLMLDLVNGFGGGTTKIAGISLDQLHISLVEYAPGTAAAALASETVSGGNTYLALGDGTHVDLFGITGLSTSNFT